MSEREKTLGYEQSGEGQEEAQAETLALHDRGTWALSLAGSSSAAEAYADTVLPTPSTYPPEVARGRKIWETPGELLSGWGRYSYRGVIGKGGAGIVLKAFDNDLKRMVALKFIYRDHAQLAMRLQWEAQAQARVEHPHVCKVYEVGEYQGQPYIAMQFIDGATLDIAAKEMSLDEKLRTFGQIAEGLHAAHREGLVHRDVKPANLLVSRTEDGRWHPYVMDFGIAREGERQPSKATPVLAGTPMYMSPEQIRGELHKIDRRTDVYELGVTMYQILAGTYPYSGRGMELFLKITEEQPKPLVEFGLDKDLDVIVAKCMEKEAGQRYESAAALAQDLSRFLEQEPISARSGVLYRAGKHVRKRVWTFVLSALVVLAVVVVGVQSHLAGEAKKAADARAEKQRKEAARKAQEARQEAEMKAKEAQRKAKEAQRKAAERSRLARSQIRQFDLRLQGLRSLMRFSVMLPLHDVRPERKRAWRRLRELEALVKAAIPEARAVGYHRLGMAYLQMGAFDKARSLLKKSWKLGDRTSGGGLLLLEWMAFQTQKSRNKDAKAFRRRTQRYLKQRDLLLRHTSSARVRIVLAALEEYDKGQWKQADARLQRGFRKNPWIYEMLELRAGMAKERMHRALRKRDLAAFERHHRELHRLLSQASQIARSNSRLYHLLCVNHTVRMLVARALKKPYLRDLQMGIASCQKALVCDPSSRPPHFQLTLLYSARSLWLYNRYRPVSRALQKALYHGEKAHRHTPHNGNLLYTLGRIHLLWVERAFWRKSYEAAHCKKGFGFLRAAGRRGHLQAPEFASLLAWRCAQVLVELGRSPRLWLDQGRASIADLQKISKRQPRAPVVARFYRALLWLEEGRSSASKAAARKAFLRGYKELLPAYHILPRFLGSTAMAQLALHLAPKAKKPSTWTSRAAKWIHKALQKQPWDPAILLAASQLYLVLADLLEAQGQDSQMMLQQAIFHLRRCIRRKNDAFIAYERLFSAYLRMARQQKRQHHDTHATLQQARQLVGKMAATFKRLRVKRRWLARIQALERGK